MIAIIVIIAVHITIIMIAIIVIIAGIIVLIIVTESLFEVEFYPEQWSFYRTNSSWPFNGH